MFRAAGLKPVLHRRWGLALDFDSWVARIGTPEPEIGVLRFLLARSLQSLGRHSRARKEFRSALTSLQQIDRELSDVWDQIGLPPFQEMKRMCREASGNQVD